MLAMTGLGVLVGIDVEIGGTGGGGVGRGGMIGQGLMSLGLLLVLTLGVGVEAGAGLGFGLSEGLLSQEGSIIGLTTSGVTGGLTSGASCFSNGLLSVAGFSAFGLFSKWSRGLGNTEGGTVLGTRASLLMTL